MTIDGLVRDEKLEYDISREATKISALLSGKSDKFEYLTGAEILPFLKKKAIEQTKLTYSPLGKALEKQTKTTEDQGGNKIDAVTNQNKTLVTLTNKDDHKDNYKKIN